MTSGLFTDLTKGPYSKDFEGLDISRHQGKIHWDELVDENPQLQFVYIKATEGSSIVDPFYRRNFDEAKKHDLLVGSYHFLSRRTSMAKQVDNFPLKTLTFRHRTCSYWWILRRMGHAVGAVPSFKRTSLNSFVW